MIIKWIIFITYYKVEMLGIKTDNRTNFNKNIKSICSKARQKLRAPLRTTSNLNIRQKNII